MTTQQQLCWPSRPLYFAADVYIFFLFFCLRQKMATQNIKIAAILRIDREYIRNAARYRQVENGIDNCDHSHMNP